MAPFPFPGLNELRDKYRYAYFSHFTTVVCTAAANLKKSCHFRDGANEKLFERVARQFCYLILCKFRDPKRLYIAPVTYCTTLTYSFDIFLTDTLQH